MSSCSQLLQRWPKLYKNLTYQITLQPNLPRQNDPVSNTLLLLVLKRRWLHSQSEFLTFSIPVCLLCLQEPGDPEKLGEFLQKDNLSMHYFCLVSTSSPLNVSWLLLYNLFSVFASSLRSITLFVFLNSFFLLKSNF